MAEKTLQEMFAELRSKSLRAANNSEQALRRKYKALMKDLQHFLADEYATLAEDGELSFSTLKRKAEYARFLEEATKRLDGITPQITGEIERLVRDTYEVAYTGLVDAISTAKDLPSLEKELASVKASTSTAIKRSVGNPIAKLTLKDTLEHKRHEITYNIRKQISIGLVNGDRYETMAKRIAETLDGDYKKAVRIVRTEAHKVREQGFCDAALDCNEAIKKGKSGLISVKIWRTGKDQRVRDTHAAMEGVMVLVDEEFELPSGATTMTPGDSGNAAEDINCRCYLSYKLLTAAEYEAATGKRLADTQTPKDFDADDYSAMSYDEYKEYASNAKYNENLRYDADEGKVVGEGVEVSFESKEAYERTARISESQQVLYKTYTGTTNSYHTNEFLRTHDEIPNDMFGNSITMLDEVFTSWEMPKNSVVTRFTDEKYMTAMFGGDTVEDVAKHIGSVIQEKQYLSTSADASFNVFADRRKCKLTMYVDEGTKCFPTLNIEESEIIFPRGTRYEILGANEVEGQVEIIVRILK